MSRARSDRFRGQRRRKTDAAGDDQAEFIAAGNQVVFRLGTGANATTGGTLAIGASTTIQFQVRVNSGSTRRDGREQSGDDHGDCRHFGVRRFPR